MESEKRIKVAHVLPELEEGGVERMVLLLAEAQSRSGMGVTVVSAGGRLVRQLPGAARHLTMPVHRKNPLTGLACAVFIARFAREQGVDVLHAHSRVPGWICYFARKFNPALKFVYTAHARLSANYGIWPLRRADAVISVSRNVRDHIRGHLPEHAPTPVIYNALPNRTVPWRGSRDATRKHLLLVGRLSEKKDPITVLEALARVDRDDWLLDVLGDGPMMGEVEATIRRLGLEGGVRLQGYSDGVPQAVADCDLFLFPSREEGLPIALMEALVSGAPALASDIPASRELVADAFSPLPAGLLPPGDVEAWTAAIRGFLDGTFLPDLKCRIAIPSVEEMASQISDLYVKLLSQKFGNFAD